MCKSQQLHEIDCVGHKYIDCVGQKYIDCVGHKYIGWCSNELSCGVVGLKAFCLLKKTIPLVMYTMR